MGGCRDLLVTWALVLLPACHGSSASTDAGPPTDASVEPTVFGGGSLVDDCGDAVTTRPGASSPRPGEDVLGDDPAPVRVHLGIAGPASTTLVVNWATRDQTTRATLVQYGKDSVDEHEVRGDTFLYKSGEDGASGPLVRVHEAELCGLESDTLYHYRVGGRGADGSESWSEPAEMRTAPAAGDASAQISVLVLGDSRNGYDQLGSLLALGDQLASPDLILFTGDAVTHGDSELEWEAFFDAAEPVLRHVPMLFAHGNHEQNTVHYYSLVSQPGNEEDFGLDYGPVHLVVLNDSPAQKADLTGSIRDFLDQDLGAHASAPWTLVMHHRAMYSASPGHGPAFDLQAAWAPLYDAHHVDLVLNGHDHDYERSLPVAAGAVVGAGKRGTVYVVAGAAGASLYRHGTAPWTAVSESTEHVIVLDVRSRQLRMTAYRQDGSLLDELTLTK